MRLIPHKSKHHAFSDSSTAERFTVNEDVTGSNPVRRAKCPTGTQGLCPSKVGYDGLKSETRSQTYVTRTGTASLV